MKDKFEIFTQLMFRESNTNHYHIYIAVGQFDRILRLTNYIYNDWDDKLTLEENVNKHFERAIVPVGDCGANKLGGLFDR